MRKQEFKHGFEIGDNAFINIQGGKRIRIIDVSFSIVNGIDYLTIDNNGTKEYYKESELTTTKIIEL